MSSLAVLALMASSVMGQAENPLQEFADDFCGSWESEWTAEEDSPDGKIKKGDKGTVSGTIKWGLNKAVLELEGRVGPTDEANDVNVKAFIAWHPCDKQIVIHSYAADGVLGKIICVKEGSVWKWVSESVDREGVMKSGETTIEIADDNNTHIHHQTKRREGDKELPDREVTYRRK